MISGKIDNKTVAILTIMIVATFFLWNTVFLFPFKIFVVLLHELSHGLAAVLTGGSIVSIELNADQGGVCATRGGWGFAVLSAGYLGSMLWGGIILLTAARTKWDKVLSIFIGLVVLFVTIFYIRSGFGFLFGLLFGASLLVIGKFLSESVNDILLKYIGLTSMLYAVFDIKDDLITRTVSDSDASVMAREYFGTPMMWGIIWIVFAVLASWFILRTAVRKT